MDLDTAGLCTALTLGALGSGLFVYGKRQQRAPQLIAGLVLIGFPYLVPGALWMAVIGALVLVALLLAVRWGM